MGAINKKFYTKGVDNQKRADITFDLKWLNVSKINKLSDETKVEVIDFLKESSDYIQAVIKAIK